MKIILYKPEIPQNAGNIIRTCSVTNTDLIIVKPCGFSLSNRMFKRAGLDYFKDVKIDLIEDLFSFLENSDKPFYFFSSKIENSYSDIKYEEDAYLIFGSETSGLDDKYFEKWPSKFVTIPMKKNARCLNLSNSVSIALYEALRQNNFYFSP